MQKNDSVIKEQLSWSKIHIPGCFINLFSVTVEKYLVWKSCKEKPSLFSLVLEAGRPGLIRWPQQFGFQGECQGGWYHKVGAGRKRTVTWHEWKSERSRKKLCSLKQLHLGRTNSCQHQSSPRAAAVTWVPSARPCLLTIPLSLKPLLEASFQNPKETIIPVLWEPSVISLSQSLYLLCRLPETRG